jgi:MOSC domain-containing protein YiiM
MGFLVTCGDLGENLTMKGSDLTNFPLGTRL